MPAGPVIRRVILTVLDGLRPDAIDEFSLVHWQAVAKSGVATREGVSVTPSVTAAAMASLFTGTEPRLHGLTSDRFHLPRPRCALDPLPLVLRRAGMATSAFLARVPLVFRGIAGRIARRVGVAAPTFAGERASDVLRHATAALLEQQAGLLFMHWPDADRAGHEWGWMSRRYGDAARRLDDALGGLVAQTRLLEDPATLLIALADHGGGGVHPRRHDSLHPRDRTIPILFAGGSVTPGATIDRAHLLDVPATALHALGVAQPPSYQGRPLAAVLKPLLVAA